ncbi:DUF4231 domain-containing protein [Streptomyces longwoodensis]|uniref:DUF4231 domain-containing protein n=1 Tax=Streptomyces longwoodensis TaxID=68231 RepID=UPI0033F9A791
MSLSTSLGDADLPPLFRTADSASLRGQGLYIRATKLRLGLAVAAAALAATTIKPGETWDLAASLVALGFLATLVLEIWLLGRNPERDWYDGRALAESVKTLSWRYSVAAAPFSRGLTDAEAEQRFVTEVEKLIGDAPADSVIVSAPVQVTPRMQGARSADLVARRSLYLEHRIENQLAWYSSKATSNSKRARGWRLTLIVIEGVGAVAAVLKAGGIVSFDLPGIMAALLGAGSAWFAVRQYEALARAYAFAAKDLSTVHTRLCRIDDEAEWAREAGDAEEAISREHTMWRASRGAYNG